MEYNYPEGIERFDPPWMDDDDDDDDDDVEVDDFDVDPFDSIDTSDSDDIID